MGGCAIYSHVYAAIGNRKFKAKPYTTISRRKSDLKTSEVRELLSTCGIQKDCNTGARLGSALDHSLSVVGLFTREPSTSAGSWKPWDRKSEKTLVAFGRATGDSSVIATIYDVAVHPNYRGFGFGKRIVDELTNQLYLLGICEVSLITTETLSAFFESSGFGIDQDETVAMTLKYPEKAVGGGVKSTILERLLLELQA